MTSASVYVITHLPTLRHYVGKARNPKARWRQHVRCESTRRSWIQRALKQHGATEFVMVIAETFDNDADAFEAEAFWIAFLRSNVAGLGFNLSAGGEGNPAFDLTDEARAKMSASSKRRWARPGEREKNADQTRRIHTGLKRTAETRRKQSEKSRGRVLSAEHREKISVAQRGKPKPGTSEKLRGRAKSPEHVAKIVAFHTGRKRSEATRSKLREAHARRREQREREKRDAAAEV